MASKAPQSSPFSIAANAEEAAILAGPDATTTETRRALDIGDSWAAHHRALNKSLPQSLKHALSMSRQIRDAVR